MARVSRHGEHFYLHICKSNVDQVLEKPLRVVLRHVKKRPPIVVRNQPTLHVSFDSDPVLRQTPERFLNASHDGHDSPQGKNSDWKVNHDRASTPEDSVNLPKIDHRHVAIVEVLKDFTRKRGRYRRF